MKKTTKKSKIVKKISVDELKIVQAEFENTLKRVEKEKQGIVDYASQSIVIKLLPILDDFESALKAVKKSKEKEMVEGLEILYNQFYSVLQENGLKQINSKNEIFDPYKHEVIQKINSKEPEGMIVEEIQKGYYFKNRVVRHTKVKISDGGNQK
ncbi:nucleotide exchange factor GrpE [archaeon]|nr:nucleotide exchange factor GrpE [archaeon]|tara:strand:+ start:3317 stop:3778 length:462 start_codon:yes stop_codon:yes gene_type:complete